MLSKRVEAVLREAAGRIDFLSPDLSFRRLREAAERIADLHETNSVTTFGWLLRRAVQEFANDIYQNIAVIYPNFVTEIRSNRRSRKFTAASTAGEMPRLTDAGEKFQDSTFKGFERELINYKFGRSESFERELFDDDQTGQVRARAGNMGENFRADGGNLRPQAAVRRGQFGRGRGRPGLDLSGRHRSRSPSATGRPRSCGWTRRPWKRRTSPARSIVDPIGRKFLLPDDPAGEPD